ncbi:SDR family NAD(P)-dependent oxidoreductase [Paenibacillus arenilitoris]|uniref:SDR family oxidoreductase n=1 Tax=Paenibacillus arenilitoris TaxID=2772299 RepID=A0A927H6T7_9BACL|nr:SDR family oxidoreductase [Paenibacillus arenilitoris]MBD2869913.1 SDR family oxidoreductase [Paenibacillus arenilitoris]
MKLQNKVVFVTDADNEVGKSVVKRLSEEGASLILNSGSGGGALAGELADIREAGRQALVVNVDLSSGEEVADMLAAAEEALGSVDVLVHNQALVRKASVETCEEALFLESLKINAKTAFFCTRAVGRQMQRKQAGSIIYVSSIHAEKPTGSSFAFSVSKGAVKMLAKEAALVLGRSGVRVNTIELGPLDGREDGELFGSDFSTLYRDYEYKVPNASLGTSDDLAELVLFLSTDGSRYVNGSDIRLDGGFLLHYMNHKMKRP